jgi:hypothetical protein
MEYDVRMYGDNIAEGQGDKITKVLYRTAKKKRENINRRNKRTEKRKKEQQEK